ncbi:MAG: type II toxin-antitoxin system HicB family antitoxin [Acidobacteria bacterium]|nr:type II toxin-antitoxin system HicB family antitoxin [Acidobacteriota bacterium]MBI3657421.1 type II toxin-antitoxin system HicB family antitoxin [Acidobacteriota bacterium]
MTKRKIETGIKHDRKPQYRYTVFYQQLLEGGYQVIVPARPGIITYGRTLEESREMAEDAMACHLKGIISDNEEIPEDPFVKKEPVRESVLVKV